MTKKKKAESPRILTAEERIENILTRYKDILHQATSDALEQGASVRCTQKQATVGILDMVEANLSVINRLHSKIGVDDIE